MIGIILIKTLIPLIISQAQPNLRVMEKENYYPSGNKDDARVYASDRPSKKYPLLTLDITACDTEFNKIEPGIYSVEYSPEDNMLLISDRQKIMKAPVFQVIKLNQATPIPSAKINFIKEGKVFIIYKNEDLEIQSFLYLPETILNMN